nr:AraC family transcriptional regulator [uncultured Moellerella sp.]
MWQLQLSHRHYSQDVISHQHNHYWQIVFGHAGMMDICMERLDYQMKAGEGIIIPPSMSHAFCGDKLNSNWVLEIPLHTRTRLNENGPLFQLTPAAVGLLDWLVHFPQPASQQVNVAKLLYAQMNIEPDWLTNLNQWLDSRLSLPLSNKDIATFLHISISSLQRRIKAETGYSIMRYLLNLRIEKACNLLLSGSDSIEQIALNVGYESHSAFGQVFRKITAMSPQEYRLKIKSI